MHVSNKMKAETTLSFGLGLESGRIQYDVGGRWLREASGKGPERVSSIEQTHSVSRKERPSGQVWPTREARTWTSSLFSNTHAPVAGTRAQSKGYRYDQKKKEAKRSRRKKRKEEDADEEIKSKHVNNLHRRSTNHQRITHVEAIWNGFGTRGVKKKERKKKKEEEEGELLWVPIPESKKKKDT